MEAIMNKYDYNTKEMMLWAAETDKDEVMQDLGVTIDGLSDTDVKARRSKYGNNGVTRGKKESLAKHILRSFTDPFTLVLLTLAAVSLVTDVALQPVGQKNPSTAIIIAVMVFLSGSLRFVQETRSEKATSKLLGMIHTTTAAIRKGSGQVEIPFDEVVVGDIIHLTSGDLIPADVRVLESRDLFVAQSAMTGESEPVEKTAKQLEADAKKQVLEYNNLAFMGTTVISGSAKVLVLATGDHTILGQTYQQVTKKPEQTSFDKGVNNVSHLLIRFMLVMVPIVFFINGFTKGDWLSALMFAVSVAVGLTPEMLPMIVTTCLASGAVAMSKKQVIMKDLNSIQNLGAIDILCTDKTGTLTEDKVVLEKYLDVHGDRDDKVLRYAYLNSYYQTGLKNLMDRTIIDRTGKEAETNVNLKKLDTAYTKVDEIPFDFERRRMSVVVKDKDGNTELITKGALEEMLAISTDVEHLGKTQPLTDELKKTIIDLTSSLNEDGYRVLAVSHKTEPKGVGLLSVEDESDMVLMGFLAFLDPPKQSAISSIQALKDYGVAVKMLTGDNDKVAVSVAKQLGLSTNNAMLGIDVENMNDKDLAQRVEQTVIFAKLSPLQKSRVVTALKKNGHRVGYMGDGINDAAALRVADIGISVDSGVDVAKEAAKAILLEKDLMVLKDGIVEGRKVYQNMIKYIRMTASSNFGNMFSVLAASAFLPFLPMEALQLIALNLIYDFVCVALPFDNADPELLKQPRTWDTSTLRRFMTTYGPLSSIFDIFTYVAMFFLICPAVVGMSYHQITDPQMKMVFIMTFQTGWFVESMWTQTLVMHTLRTPKIPFIESHASRAVNLATFLGIAFVTLLPMMPFAKGLGFISLPLIYYPILLVMVIGYVSLVTFVKLHEKKMGRNMFEQ